jgi:hypothetical protein
MNKSLFVLHLAILLFATLTCFAQKKTKKSRPVQTGAPATETIYDNINYLSEIKSVEFYNTKEDQSFPILTLGSEEQLHLKFDDLREGSRNFFYTFEHCDAEWRPSSITPIDYLESFNEDRINNYRQSYNTFQKYTHYQLTLPSKIVRPKISGNYLLKVYEDSDTRRLILTRRFYVVQQKVGLSAEIIRSPINTDREKKQKINFNISHPGLNIQNPYQEIRTVVMQNNRNDISFMTSKPLFVRNNQLVYSDNLTHDFYGGNEFRRFDTRSFRFKSQTTAQIYQDSLYTVKLFDDELWNNNSYTSQVDENGKFFIINQDGTNNDYDADYGYVDFTLNTILPETSGYVYIVGQFNNYQKDNLSRMNYDPAKKQFTHRILAKQGVTEYHYTWANDTGKIINDALIDGSFFETENDYQILVYYKAPGSRFEELIAFTELNSVRKNKIN